MEIPEPGEEGYIVRVTKNNRKYLSEICGWYLYLDSILNYDPSRRSSQSGGYYSYRKYDEDNSYITLNSTVISVEQLQQILFIESLEN